jgi:hypothetical protein
MKTLLKGILLLSAIVFMSSGCTHDEYIPVPGENGQDGSDGISGTASCESCHSVEHREPIIASFDLSVHNLGVLNADGTRSKHIYGTNSTFDDGSLNSDRAFCSQCHSQEGFIDAAKYGKPNPTGYNNFQSISCEGCHGTTHRSFDFETDGNDYGLRLITAVTQKINPTFTLDASPTGGKSSSNTCLACHQTRPDANGYFKRPVLESGEKDFDNNVVISNTANGPMYRFWSERALAKAMPGYPSGTTNYKAYANTSLGVHESTSGDIWMGITGIDIEGTTTHLPAAKTAAHYQSNSCITCHMDTPKTGTTDTGSHSLALSYVSCEKCHTDPETLVESFHTDYDAKIEVLRLALSAKTAYFKTATSGSISINFPTLPTVTGSKDATVWDVERTDFPLKYAQAYWNYKLLIGDFSKGVHNPKYAKALIQNSIEALN